jgi:signal transduction histidine kinase
LVFQVADRGSGIAPEILGRVGEPFFTTKPTGKGMGLGIFLARAIVERLGGELSIGSAPGAGTTATVSLPIGQTL